MSGRKSTSVTIDQSRYDALLNNTRRADDAIHTAEQRVRQERQRNRKMQQRFEKRRREMQREYANGLKSLRSEIGRLEAAQVERLEAVQLESTRRLDQVRRKSAQELNEARRESAQSVATLGDDLRRRIAGQGERFEEALRDQGERFQGALHEHRTDVDNALQAMQNDIRVDRDRQRVAAQRQIDDVEALFQLMREQRTHERFAPGELDELQTRFSICRRNLQDGNFQAALAGGQERYFDYQDLQLRVAERQAEWQAYLDEVQRLSEETAGALAAADAATYAFGDGDAAQNVEAQIDYWSEGSLAEFRQQLTGYLQRLESPEDLVTADLKQMLEELAPMEAELADIVAAAKERLVQSQVRRDIAASIAASFEGTNWEVRDSTYEAKDFRRAFHLKLKNNADETIVASVTPVNAPAGELTATVEINFFDRFNDAQLREARLQTMHDRMRTEGVNVGQFGCLDGSEDRSGAQAMLDFERLRSAQPASRAS